MRNSTLNVGPGNDTIELNASSTRRGLWRLAYGALNSSITTALEMRCSLPLATPQAPSPPTAGELNTGANNDRVISRNDPTEVVMRSSLASIPPTLRKRR